MIDRIFLGTSLPGCGNAFDASDFGYRVFGGYNFIPYLGAEIEDTSDVYLWSASVIWRF